MLRTYLQRLTVNVLNRCFGLLFLCYLVYLFNWFNCYSVVSFFVSYV